MSTSRLLDLASRIVACSLFAMTCFLMITGVVVGPNGHSLQAQDSTGAAVTSATMTIDPDASALGLSAPGSSWVTPDLTPEITGTGKPGTTIEVQVDGKVIGYADVSKDGTWRLTPKSVLTTGTHQVTIAVGERPPEATKKPTMRVGEGDPSSILDKGLSFFGIFFLIGVAVLMSNNRRKINWQLVGVGVGLQLAFAVVIFYVPFGKEIFAFATAVIKKLLDFTGDGASFIFRSFVTGAWEPGLINFTFAILPTIIFFSSIMTILYHIGVMQFVVGIFAKLMQRTMNTSGAESLSAAANIFVGQTEAPLVIKPYVDEMTKSELMTVMTGGFATVAGGVLAIYVGLLEPAFPDIAGHLLAASVMSAPAALVIGKIIYPETEVPVTSGELNIEFEKEDANVIDAASRGAAEGLQLALNVGAMLLAFIALISLANYIVALPSMLYNSGVLKDLAELYAEKQMALPDGCMPDTVANDKLMGCVATMQEGASTDMWTMPVLTLQMMLGYLFAPFAFAMGVPWQDCLLIGQLLGEKMILNELVAYTTLNGFMADPNIQLADRSVIIATYALCGFANIGSIGIQIGGIGGIAPKRKGDLARIAFRAMLAGTLAAFMTATVAGILV